MHFSLVEILRHPLFHSQAPGFDPQRSNSYIRMLNMRQLKVIGRAFCGHSDTSLCHSFTGEIRAFRFISN